MVGIYLALRNIGYKASRAIEIARALLDYHAGNQARWQDAAECGYPPSDAWALLQDVGVNICGPHAYWGDYGYDVIRIEGYDYAVL